MKSHTLDTWYTPWVRRKRYILWLSKVYIKRFTLTFGISNRMIVFFPVLIVEGLPLPTVTMKPRCGCCGKAILLVHCLAYHRVSSTPVASFSIPIYPHNGQSRCHLLKGAFLDRVDEITIQVPNRTRPKRERHNEH